MPPKKAALGENDLHRPLTGACCIALAISYDARLVVFSAIDVPRGAGGRCRGFTRLHLPSWDTSFLFSEKVAL